MSFLNTAPVAIDRLDLGGTWHRFRVDDPRRRLATLHEICRQDAPVTIGAVAGLSLTASLWAVDDLQGRLAFNADPSEGGLTRLLAQPDLWAAAYLDEAKVQFTLHRVLADRANKRLSLQSDAPLDMYHLPRRRTVRVRQAPQAAPRVSLRCPRSGAGGATLSVADVSLTGCALRQSAGQLELVPGAVIRGVELALDHETFIFTDLRVEHVTRDPQREGHWQLGCTWLGMPPTGQVALQRWILRGHRRRELLTLSLD